MIRNICLKLVILIVVWIIILKKLLWDSYFKTKDIYFKIVILKQLFENDI